MTGPGIPATRAVARSSRRTLVTGASLPLGLAFVRQALARGDKVYAACRNPARVAALVALRGEHAGLELVSLDPADPVSVADAIPVLEGLTDSLDLLVLGPVEHGPHERASDLVRDESLVTLSGTGLVEHYRRHAVAPVLLVRTLLPWLARYDGARVLATTSTHGVISAKHAGGDYATCASAAAYHMLVRTIAFDLADERIPLLLGHPGAIVSETHDDDAGLASPLEHGLPLDDAAGALLALVDNLGPEESGSFLDSDGNALSW